MGIRNWIIRKLFNFQPRMLSSSITEIDMASTYESISTLSRCVDMIVNSCAEVPFNLFEYNGRYYKPVDRRPGWASMLVTPSKDLDMNAFYKTIYRDLLFKGNSLLYNTRLEFQHIPVFQFNPQENTIQINDQTLEFTSDFILIRLLHGTSDFFAKPYIDRVSSELSLIRNMLKFEAHYYKNNGVPGIILKTERPLSSSFKERILNDFKTMTSIMHGKAGDPYILDQGIEIDQLQRSFKELEFKDNMNSLESRIIRNLGVPETLIKGGNNANITPNIRLFYFLTIKPLVETVASALTHHIRLTYKDAKKTYFIRPDFDSVSILRDDFNSYSSSVKGLYTVGLVSRNEARELLRLEKLPEDTFLTPANIAGSATNPDTGGRPSGDSGGNNANS